jgi:hypothetical protein
VVGAFDGGAITSDDHSSREQQRIGNLHDLRTVPPLASLRDASVQDQLCNALGMRHRVSDRNRGPWHRHAEQRIAIEMHRPNRRFAVTLEGQARGWQRLDPTTQCREYRSARAGNARRESAEAAHSQDGDIHIPDVQTMSASAPQGHVRRRLSSGATCSHDLHLVKCCTSQRASVACSIIHISDGDRQWC